MSQQSTSITVCNPLREYKNDNKPIQLCSTCDLNIQHHRQPFDPRVARWITVTPAFWNGERYVCEHHMEIQHAGA